MGGSYERIFKSCFTYCFRTSHLFDRICIFYDPKKSGELGKPLAVLIFLGLMLCVLVAVRDGYGFRSDAVIAFTGWQATLFSVLGISILLIGLIALINRNL
jgi:predicted membrane protein